MSKPIASPQQIEVDKVGKGKSKVPRVLEFSWDGRIRSSRELFRLLHDFLNKYGYEHVYHELKDVAGAIEGTAIFSDSLVGKKDHQTINWWMIANSAILLITGGIVAIKGYNAISVTFEGIIAGMLILVAGSNLAGKASNKIRKSISLHVEGETYRARAEKKGETSLEAYDVISNCRVIFSGKVGKPVPQVVVNAQHAQSKSDTLAYDVIKLSGKTSDWDSLKSEFNSLTAEFKNLRPRIEIPTVVADSKKE